MVKIKLIEFSRDIDSKTEQGIRLSYVSGVDYFEIILDDCGHIVEETYEENEIENTEELIINKFPLWNGKL